MAFAKGRTTEQACIEDTFEMYLIMIDEVSEIISNKTKSFDAEMREIAKNISAGDAEIELDSYNQLSRFNLFDDCLLHSQNSFALMAYSFYEKSLKMLADNNGIKIKDKTKRSYAIKYYNGIEKYIISSNLCLNSKTQYLVNEIDIKFRDLRNSLVHDAIDIERSDIYISFSNKQSLIEFLNKVKCILLDINKTLEQLKNREV